MAESTATSSLPSARPSSFRGDKSRGRERPQRLLMSATAAGNESYASLLPLPAWAANHGRVKPKWKPDGSLCEDYPASLKPSRAGSRERERY
ncbi:hypothetical protein MY1884_007445 [Beauveria asiatica]